MNGLPESASGPSRRLATNAMTKPEAIATARIIRLNGIRRISHQMTASRGRFMPVKLSSFRLPDHRKGELGTGDVKSKINTADAITVVHTPRLSPTADCVTFAVRTILFDSR